MKRNKYFLKFFSFVLAFSMLFSSLSLGDSLSKYGSSGKEVTTIQTKLKRWGYFNGTVDGIYGTETKKAVIAFQKKNNLTADGIAGKRTLEALGISSSSGTSQYKSSELTLLAMFISAEARGETYSGQVAVGAVILNRIEHPSFPNTIAGVLYQPGAFSCLQDGQINKPISDSAFKAAQDAFNGWDPSGGAIYYYNPQTATNSWIRSRKVITTIGDHVFCL